MAHKLAQAERWRWLAVEIREESDLFEWNAMFEGKVGRGYSIGSNCPGISGTVPDFKNLSRIPERYGNCPGRELSFKRIYVATLFCAPTLAAEQRWRLSHCVELLSARRQLRPHWIVVQARSISVFSRVH